MNFMFYSSFSQEYLTLDSRGINVFYYDGRFKDQIEPEEPIDRLVYCRGSKRYVGWTPTEEYIKVSYYPLPD